jgi:hypothetical protein
MKPGHRHDGRASLFLIRLHFVLLPWREKVAASAG